MKAKELVEILLLTPEAEVEVSTVSYYEKSFQDSGYKRTESQSVTDVRLIIKDNIVSIDGGRAI
ncbi:hypothetical protein [Enterococcus durans]|uniref:hypothetical protein n=1 Tax=Enterococcus durans TaxID=53345 RepID=UPI001E49B453|nr:hypothetical protein [Enterococcus durans]MCD5011116.1 hypothetical protein [Enterococcus durans]